MKILVIDDEQLIRRSLERHIEHRGDTPFSAGDGHSALQILETTAIDLVITDIKMPKIDGLQVLQAIKASHPEMPVIIITGYSDTQMAIEAINNGASAFLQKPVLSQDLDAKLDDAVQEISTRRDEHARFAQLQRTAQEQRQRLEREKAFSAAILRNIPSPVCLIDRQHRIHMANSAFHQAFAPSALQVEGEGLQLFLPELSPNEALSQSRITVRRPSGDERHFEVAGFAVDTDIEKGLTCFFFQDITIEVKSQEEANLRQWCLDKTYTFREQMVSLVNGGDPLRALTDYLAHTLAHFNPVRVQMDWGDKTYIAGLDAKASGQTYLSEVLALEGEVHGHIHLAAQAPRSAHIQRDYLAKLVEIACGRLESHQLELRLLQADRLRALGEMAACVAHELNQPLSGIRTFAEGVLYALNNDWPLSPEEVKETQQDIIDQADRMTAIIDHMRGFSRDTSQQDAVSFHIGAVIGNVFKLVNSQLKAQEVEVRVDIDPNLPPCKGWPQQLEQVFFNLISNACHAMEEIAARSPDQRPSPSWKPSLSFTASQQENALQIEVTDSGGGIPESIAERVFEPFFTSKRVGEGTGLGLSISRNILDKHNGTLHLVNRPKNGTTFIVRLPIEIEDGPSPSR